MEDKIYFKVLGQTFLSAIDSNIKTGDEIVMNRSKGSESVRLNGKLLRGANIDEALRVFKKLAEYGRPLVEEFHPTERDLAEMAERDMFEDEEEREDANIRREYLEIANNKIEEFGKALGITSVRAKSPTTKQDRKESDNEASP